MQHQASSRRPCTPLVAGKRGATASADDKQLSRLIQSAWRQVPFYGTHWQAIAAQLPSLRFPAQLHEIPIVQKADLLAQPAAALLDRSYGELSLTIEKTSGSSGQPLEILKDPATVRRRSLRFLRALLSCGYRPGQRLLLISSRRTAGVMKFARWHYADLRDEHLQQEYQRVRPDVLYGPLSSLLQICDRPGMPGDFHRPAIVISTAEQMLAPQRALLEKTFNCAVADFYGMTELGLVAFRRPGADCFEPASNDLLLEFLSIAGDSSSERLIATDLTGGAMPMIRYDTGDLVLRRTENQETIIRGFVGRSVDSLKLASGGSISPYRVEMRLEVLPSLRQFQVVQRKDLSLDIYFHADEKNSDAVRQDIVAAFDELCRELPRRIHFQKHGLHKVEGKFRAIQSEARTA